MSEPRKATKWRELPTGAGIGIGVAPGAALRADIDQVGPGVAFGVAFGAALDGVAIAARKSEQSEERQFFGFIA